MTPERTLKSATVFGNFKGQFLGIYKSDLQTPVRVWSIGTHTLTDANMNRLSKVVCEPARNESRKKSAKIAFFRFCKFGYISVETSPTQKTHPVSNYTSTGCPKGKEKATPYIHLVAQSSKVSTTLLPRSGIGKDEVFADTAKRRATN